MRLDVFHHLDFFNTAELEQGMSDLKVSNAVLVQKMNDLLAGQVAASAAIAQQGVSIMADLSVLTAQVTKNTEVEAGAVILIKGLADQIAALKTDPVALQALADQLNGSAVQLSEAITANTPPTEPPPAAFRK